MVKESDNCRHTLVYKTQDGKGDKLVVTVTQHELTEILFKVLCRNSKGLEKISSGMLT